MTEQQTRRAARLAAYDRLREQRPHLFHNPPDAAYEIVLDPAVQEEVADAAAEKLREAGVPEQYGDIGVVYQDPYVMLVRDAVRFRSGRHGAYIREVSPEEGTGAAVLTLTPDDRIVLVRHFRHESRNWHWEAPRGFAEPGADGAATAVREVVEELGVEPAEITFLGRFGTGTDGQGGTDELWLARLAQAPAIGDDVDEGIDEVIAVTPAEFAEMMRDGRMSDTFTLAAYAYAVVRGLWPA
ncbi:hypothetical protein Cs7R123_60580 [Catellatospora sp. TT07R-123]|uniref:NUDIX hydrolase n=1 Tax=Catellatospora sp. TT07R-123 TaxID=2733863 RepID=UPI001B1E52EF|nr:NUDIX hydrolase [Catellatospora sp. TT07R-123]GHJ48716.1 hypothetical protein Cs7R123_60580 [Catellatospora sp. TT07R-123]